MHHPPLPLTFFGLLFGCFTSIVLAQTPSFVVSPYLQFATPTSIRILFETEPSYAAEVRYGPALVGAKKANLSQRVVADKASMHELLLEGLSPATKYVYQVLVYAAQGDTLKSEILTFNTAVRKEDAYTFALIGDTQFNEHTPWAWETVAERVWEQRPNFVVHLGDLVDKGSLKSDWTQDFFPKGRKVLSRYAVYSVLGNHEQDAAHYYQYMANPAPEYYYTFHYGNAQFFMLDSNKDVFAGSEQYDWLEWQLAASDAQWKFVVFHHPPYSSEENDHGDTYVGASSFQTATRSLVPLMEAYGVDFNLFGHTHVYERSWPLYEDKVDRKKGVVYINSGGAGGSLEGFDPVNSWFSVAKAVTHHFCTFSIHEDYMQFKAIDHEGKVFDTFEYSKSPQRQSALASPLPPAPHFKANRTVFADNCTVELLAFDEAHRLVYTTDGSEPDEQSENYRAALTFDRSLHLQARAIDGQGRMSRVVSQKLQKMDTLRAVYPKKTKAGLAYAYYEGEWEEKLPDFSQLKALRNGQVESFDLHLIPDRRADQFALVYSGYVDIPLGGTYTLFTRSDDGSKLYIDEELIVDNDGNHGAFYRYGVVVLAPGKHRLSVTYFDGKHEQMLEVGYLNAKGEKILFSPAQLSH